MSEVLGPKFVVLPDPLSFLEVEPGEIAGYRVQGRATGLDVPVEGIPKFNNFYVFWGGLTIRELIDQEALKEDRVNNAFSYAIYYKIKMKDSGDRGEKLLAAFHRFAVDYPIADRYLRDASIFDLISRGSIHPENFTPSFRSQVEEILGKINQWQMAQIEKGERSDYMTRLYQVAGPVIAFSLDRISNYSGIPWNELVT